jgi:hypothetical protein
VKQDTTPILGTQTIQKLKLVTIHYNNILAVDEALTEKLIFDEYKDVFHGTGCLPGTYHRQTDETVTPEVHPPRKIPVSLRERLKSELDQLTDKEIITPVTEPIPWVNNLVIVEQTKQTENMSRPARLE